MGAFASRIAMVLVALVGLAGPAAHAEPFAYFTQPNGMVQAVDVATQAVVQTFDMGGTPPPCCGTQVTVAVAPAARRAFLTTKGSALPALSPAYPTVSVVNTTTQTVLVSRVLPIIASRAVVSANGERLYLFGYNYCYGMLPCITAIIPMVAVFDTRSLTTSVFDTMTIDASALALNERQGRLYASDATAGAVRVLDLQVSQTPRTIPVGAGTSGLAFDAISGRLYASNAGANTVSVIDTNTETVIAMIAVGSHPTGVAVHPSGSPLLVASDGQVQVFDAASRTLIRAIALAGAQGVGITPDGTLAYVARPSAGLATAIRLSDFTPVADVALGGAPAAEGMFIGAGPAPAVAAPDILTGLWWNPSQPGWGMHLTQRGSTVFGAWFTYDQNGAPKWYVAPNCRFEVALPCATCIEDQLCAGELRETHGPAFFLGPFDPANVRSTAVGFLQMRFRDHSHASINFSVDGKLGGGEIERQVFRVPADVPGVNYTDLWFDPFESGWGMGLVQQGDNIFVAWYVYNDVGQPMWYVASNCAVKGDGNGCTGDLYRTLASPGPGSGLPFDPSRVAVTKAGRIDVTFSGQNNAYIAYEVDGRSGGKYLVRQVF